MSDMVVSVGLSIVEEQVLVRVLVAHEKPMMTDIPESFSENDGCYYGVFFCHVCVAVCEEA